MILQGLSTGMPMGSWVHQAVFSSPPFACQMLRLESSISPPSSLHSNKQRKSVCLKFRRWNTRRIGRFNSPNAVEKDSEFEVDPDKAREALRKLDEQIQSLSKKQVDPPKIRASSLGSTNRQMDEEATEISGSFLASAAAALIIFTIVYNVIFLTVIKPSVDGPEPVPTRAMKEAEEQESLQRLSEKRGLFQQL